MGDYFHTIVIPKISEEDADWAVERVRSWLIQKAIIDSEVNDSPLGGLGHKPGTEFQKVVKNEDDIYFLLPELRTNGMRIKSGRQVFYGWIFLGVFKLYCQTCGNIELDFDDSGETVSELVSAIDSWVKRSPETEFGCPVCGTQKPLEDWDFGDTLAFGNLGFEFWNWPTFKDSFISDISSLLGYDVKVVSGKI